MRGPNTARSLKYCRGHGQSHNVGGGEKCFHITQGHSVAKPNWSYTTFQPSQITDGGLVTGAPNCRQASAGPGLERRNTFDDINTDGAVEVNQHPCPFNYSLGLTVSDQICFQRSSYSSSSARNSAISAAVSSSVIGR